MHGISKCICVNKSPCKASVCELGEEKTKYSNCGTQNTFPNDIDGELIDRSESLVYLMTHVCTRKLTGIFRTPGTDSEYCCRRLPVSSNRNDGNALERQIPKSCQSRASKMTPMGMPPPDSSPPAPHSGREITHPCACLRNNQISKNVYYKDSLALRSPSSKNDPQPRPNYAPLSSWTPSWYPPWWGGGPRSSWSWRRSLHLHHVYAFVFILLAFFARATECCSSRSTPKPRPASPTLRPNVTFQTYACPPAYAAWYCLNGATCFTVKIQDAILYNCECAEGYMGPRCEFKDPDGSYLHESQRVLLETASIAGGAIIAILLVFTILFTLYVFFNKDTQKKRSLNDPFHDQRSLQDKSGDETPTQWPQYVYTVGSLLSKSYWNPSYVKELPRYHLDIDVPHHSSPPVVEVKQVYACQHHSPVEPRIASFPCGVDSDRQTQRLLSVIVPK